MRSFVTLLLVGLTGACISQPDPWSPGDDQTTADSREMTQAGDTGGADTRAADHEAGPACGDTVCPRQECGTDPCGASCGECGSGQACVAGSCIAASATCDDGNATDWDGCTGGHISEFQVNEYTVQDQRAPRVAALAGGGFVVVWESCHPETWAEQHEHHDDFGCGVYSRRFGPLGQPLGSETEVNVTTMYNQLRPAVAALPDGGYVIAYKSWNPQAEAWDLMVRPYNADGTAGTEMTVTTWVQEETWPIELAASADGSLALVWRGDRELGGASIFATFLAAGADPGSDWTAPADLREVAGEDVGDPRVNGLDGARFFVTWDLYLNMTLERDAHGVLVDLAVHDPSDADTFPPPNILVSSDQNYAQGAAVAAGLPGGDVFAVFISSAQGDAGPSLFGRRFGPDDGQGDEEKLLEFAVDYYFGLPDVEVSADGTLRFVSWQRRVDYENPLDGIFFAAYDATYKAKADPLHVNVREEFFETHARLARLQSDNLVVVWQSCPYDPDAQGTIAPGPDSDGCAVYAALLAPDGSRIQRDPGGQP